VSRIAKPAQGLLFVSLALLFSSVTGCSTPAVGDPCLPEQVPETGFDDSEAYVESSSVQCETRVCIVYHLGGDPRDGCVETPSTCVPDDDTMCPETTRCASPTEIDERVYCTCRCDSGNTGFAECECPDGFSCVDVLEQGGPGVRGGYCVRNSSVSGG
jgi:hypothetical protein